jgi:hypothetical protein
MELAESGSIAYGVDRCEFRAIGRFPTAEVSVAAVLSRTGGAASSAHQPKGCAAEVKSVSQL